jgi:hypothetical protein
MQDPRNLSWFQFNQSRKFPLLHDCTGRSRDGHFTLPDDLLTGLYLSYSMGAGYGDPGGFYIGRIVYFESGLTLAIHYREQGVPTVRLVAETTLDFASNRRTVSLLGYGNGILHGTLILGETRGLASQPAGVWEFDRSATAIDPFCLRPTANELSALYVQNQGKTAGPFYGNVTLAAGPRIRLTVRSADNLLHCLETPSSGTGTEVVIGSPEEEMEGTNDTCIHVLGGVTPDQYGNITILGRSCLNITTQPEQSTILLDDTCAEPCCTCKELAPVQEKIEELTRSVMNLESHLATLSLQADFLGQLIPGVVT